MYARYDISIICLIFYILRQNYTFTKPLTLAKMMIDISKNFVWLEFDIATYIRIIISIKWLLLLTGDQVHKLYDIKILALPLESVEILPSSFKWWVEVFSPAVTTGIHWRNHEIVTITNSDLNRPCCAWHPYRKSGLFKTELNSMEFI